MANNLTKAKFSHKITPSPGNLGPQEMRKSQQKGSRSFVGEKHASKSLYVSPRAEDVRIDQRFLIATPDPTTLLNNNQWRAETDLITIYNLEKNLKYEQLKMNQIEEMGRWKEADVKGYRKSLYLKMVTQKNDDILNVVTQTDMEQLISYEDRFPCLELRKYLLKFKIKVNQFAVAIISHKVFEYGTITVILLNSLQMTFENPAAPPPKFIEVNEDIFLGLYTFEMVMKILGMGLILNKNAYLRDAWGLLDFLIVMSAYLTKYLESQKPPRQVFNTDQEQSSAFNLNALRAFRVLRPLRTITSIKGLKVLVQSILSALPMMKQTIIVLLFFFLVFSIAGVQLLQGVLLNRCIVAETGQLMMENNQTDTDQLCGGVEECPAGHFCGKINQNPNHGVTNLDNVFYGLFMVFQCTTLEGWTEIQTMYQKTLSMWIAIFFIAMVFIGAFFLINLTLAVINASFTKSQQANKDAEKEHKEHLLANNPENEGDELDQDEKNMDKLGEIGINEFFVAKRAARRMIDFMERRRAIRKAYEEKQQVELVNGVQGTEGPLETPTLPNETPDKMLPNWSNSQAGVMKTSFAQDKVVLDAALMKPPRIPKSQAVTPNKLSSALGPAALVIPEEDLEDDEFQVDRYNDEVRRFLRESGGLSGPSLGKQRAHQRSQQHLNVDLNPQAFSRDKTKKLQTSQSNLNLENQLSRNPSPSGFNGVRDGRTDGVGSLLSENSRIHEELDFDKIIKPKAGKQQDGLTNEKRQDTPPGPSGDHPFDLSFVNSISHIDQDSAIFMSEDPAKSKAMSYQDIHSIIDSDDSLQDQLEAMKRLKVEEDRVTKMQTKKLKEPDMEFNRRATSHISNLKQRIRRVSTSEWLDDKSNDALHQQSLSTILQKHEQEISLNQTELGAASTIHFRKGQNGETFRDGRSINASESKTNKEIENSMILAKKQQAAEARKKQKEQEMKQTVDLTKIDQNFLRQEQPRDPYAFIDRKAQKIEINHGVPYGSTSQDDIFEPRIHRRKAAALHKKNKFIAKPIDPKDIVEDEAAFKRRTYMPKCTPYQSKAYYKIIVNDQEMSDSEEDDEEYMMGMAQPYDTVMNIGYNYYLTHLPTKFIFKRSDILVSSTLSITLSPIQFGNEKKHLAEMDSEEVKEWVDRRHEYKAHEIINTEMPPIGFVPAYYKNAMRATFKNQKEKQFQSSDTPIKVRQNPTLESEMQSDFNLMSDNVISSAESKFGMPGKPAQTKLIPGCLLRDPLTPEEQFQLGPEERRLYNFHKNKYDATCRNLKKMTEQLTDRVISIEDAKNMRIGQFSHYGELDEDDFNEQAIVDQNKNAHVRQESGVLLNLENFERMALEISKKKEDKIFYDLNQGDEIPQDLRDELDLPSAVFMNRHDVDFNEVRDKDCNLKRRTHFWSGQEVLQDSLTDAHSIWVVTYLNNVKVWPKNFYGYVKKMRNILKVIVRSGPFDNAMLISVLCNTIVMSMDRYDLETNEKKVLEDFNSFFTWIFIIEMSMKLTAIGPRKYVSEVMNIVDGSVVLLSIVEMVIAGDGEQGSLQAFRSIRIFRTFRVLRVVRILRVLSSMQTIVGVLQRSISSFTYIAMLLMVCCFIFALLGKTLFGGNFHNADGTKPRGNFDTFNLAFITVFQVLTMENWQNVAFDSMKGSMGMWGPAIFYIVWIFLGNFILLNLFLAILLDSFLTEDEEESAEFSEEMLEAKRKKKEHHRDLKEKEKMRKLKKLGSSMFQSFNQQMMRQKQRKATGFRMLTQAVHGGNQDDLIVDDIEDLDEKTVREIFMDQGLLKDHTNERKKAKMYKDNYCYNSFYVFNKGSQFRDACYTLQSNQYFDNLVMCLIGLNSTKLAVDTYFSEYPEDHVIVKTWNNIDYFFNICFAIEALIKSIALGFMQDEGSYLRESWNQLDFFIVMTSFVDMGMVIAQANTEVGALKIIRLLRILRPLRVVSHNQAMKMIVTALFESVGAIMNVLIVVLVVWLMFAILQISLLSGNSFYCSIDKYRLHRKDACNTAGGSWIKYDSNYDNIAEAMMTLFIVATLEGWPDIMLQSVDSTKTQMGPSFENQPAFIYFYIVFILIGSFFLLNFFIGVLFLKYTQAQKDEQRGFSEKQILWKELQRMIPKAKVAHDQLNRPKVAWRKKIWKFVNSNAFDFSIMGFIVLNMIQMSLTHEGATANFDFTLRLANYIFTTVFLLEMILKLLAYGWSYFQTDWNKFDFGVVIASLFDIALEILSTAGANGEKNLLESLQLGSIAKVLRVFRISRVLRLVNRSKEMSSLMQTIQMSVGALLSVFSLLLLILFMFAVLGVNFFQRITDGNVLDDRYKNFRNFMQAFVLLFGISTGEDWNRVMYDTIDTPPNCISGETCGWSYTAVYFISFIMIITQVMLNLFILVIIQQFDLYYVKDDNPIKTFGSSYEKFHSVWIIHTRKQRCIRIRQRNLTQFFKELPQPIGFKTSAGGQEIDDDELVKKILSMGIKVDDGWIYFNELLYRCMKRVYCDFKLNKRMQLLELNTQFKIFVLTLQTKSSSSEYSSFKQTNEMVVKKVVQTGASVNPFLTMMYYRISFFTWLNAHRKHKEATGKLSPDQKRSFNNFNTAEGWDAKEVSIEVEEIVEFTSDEEEPENEQGESEDLWQTGSQMKFSRQMQQKSAAVLKRSATHTKTDQPRKSNIKISSADKRRVSQSVMNRRKSMTINKSNISKGSESP